MERNRLFSSNANFEKSGRGYVSFMWDKVFGQVENNSEMTPFSTFLSSISLSGMSLLCIDLASKNLQKFSFNVIVCIFRKDENIFEHSLISSSPNSDLLHSSIARFVIESPMAGKTDVAMNNLLLVKLF